MKPQVINTSEMNSLYYRVMGKMIFHLLDQNSHDPVATSSGDADTSSYIPYLIAID